MGDTDSDRGTGSADELQEKFEAYQQSRDRELRNEIVTSYAGLAHSVARRFARRDCRSGRIYTAGRRPTRNRNWRNDAWH